MRVRAGVASRLPLDGLRRGWGGLASLEGGGALDAADAIHGGLSSEGQDVHLGRGLGLGLRLGLGLGLGLG